MNRFKAFAIHLLISISVISAFVIFVYYIWYDQIYLEITGVIKPLKLIVLVDVVLGPLLTLLVFKPNKKKLKLDLSIIILFQLLAFAYGAYSIHLGKPSLVALKDNSFEVVAETSLKNEELNQSLNKLSHIFSKPVYTYILPDQLNTYLPAYMQQKAMRTLDFSSGLIDDKSMTLDRVEIFTQFSDQEIQIKLNQVNLNNSDAKFYLLTNNGKFYIIVFDSKSLKPKLIIKPKEAEATNS